MLAKVHIVKREEGDFLVMVEDHNTGSSTSFTSPNLGAGWFDAGMWLAMAEEDDDD